MKQKSVDRITDSILAAEAMLPKRQPLHPLVAVTCGVGILTGIFVSVSAAYLAYASREPEILVNGRTPLEDLVDAVSAGFADLADVGWMARSSDSVKMDAGADLGIGLDSGADADLSESRSPVAEGVGPSGDILLCVSDEDRGLG